MADARKHVAHSGVDGWLARRTRRPEGFSSQVSEAVIPTRILVNRDPELRRAGVVLVDGGFVTLCALTVPPCNSTRCRTIDSRIRPDTS